MPAPAELAFLCWFIATSFDGASIDHASVANRLRGMARLLRPL
jgi:hypothetical protein